MRVIKRDVITRHGGPLQLQPPRNSPSIRQQSRQRVGERRGKNGTREREGEKWRIKERRRYGPERKEIRTREREQQQGAKRRPEHEGKRKREIERGKRVILAGQGLIYHG